MRNRSRIKFSQTTGYPFDEKGVKCRNEILEK
jgi:hypothetical protein